MGGESSPWGIAWGTPAGDPTILSVPEPRNRDRVAQMATDFAPVLLAHLFHPEHSDIQIYSIDEQRPLRQVWLPNASHVDMLHHLAYTYTFARKGEPGRIPLLNALGRAAGWLFREYNRPGQMTLLAASEALKESFTFPSEDVRQGHLGYLLAWLETDGGRDARLAAAANAEEQSISTTLNPAIERDDLEGLVERYGEAERSGKPTEMKGAANDIAGILGRELTRRFELTARAINWLRHDPRRVNAGANPLLQDGRAPFWFGYMKTERSLVDDPSAPPFVPSPETDRRPATAAGNYFAQQGYEDRQEMLILEDDVEMQAEAFAAGEAIHGRISRVRDEGTGRKKTPVWDVLVDSESATKLGKDKKVFVAGLRGRQGRIRRVDLRDRKTSFEIEITDLKTVSRSNSGGAVVEASSRTLEGKTVTLLAAPLEGIQDLKRRKLREPIAPGGWLTDSKPAGRRTRIPVEITGPLEEPPDDGGRTG